MSLDVYLEGPEIEELQTCCECGHERMVKRCERFYEDNITHNLNTMAERCGIYKELWRPEEIGVTKASQLIKPLTAGLAKLRANPTRFRKFDSPNGWGTYEHLFEFVENYLEACKENPEANVRASR